MIKANVENTKINSVKHKKMNKMYKEGYNTYEIAAKFGVSQRTAWVHTASPKLVNRSKEKRRENMRIEHNKKYAKDPKYREKIKKSMRELESKQKKAHPNWSRTCRKSGHENSKLKQICKNFNGKCRCPCHYKK